MRENDGMETCLCLIVLNFTQVKDKKDIYVETSHGCVAPHSWTINPNS